MNNIFNYYQQQIRRHKIRRQNKILRQKIREQQIRQQQIRLRQIIHQILPLIYSKPIVIDDNNNNKIVNPKYNIKFYNNLNSNVNSKKTIINVLDYSSGIGDFLRGSIFLAQCAKFFNVNLELYMSNHNIIKCLKNENENENKIHINNHNHYGFSGDNNNSDKFKLLLLINKFKKSKNTKLYITTNLNYNINCVSSDIKNYINSCFKFKQFYYDEINKLFNLQKYNVIHIRCQDDNFDRDFNDNLLISKINNLKLNNNTIVISNNNSLKQKLNKLFGFYFIDSKAVHTANITNVNDLYSTIIEYIILSKSLQTYCFSYYRHGSGFSEQCSVLNNVPYTVFYINNTLKINYHNGFHNGGFFSCFTMTLYDLIIYFNNNNVLPELDRSNGFRIYKCDDNIDIAFDFFKHYDDFNCIIKIQNITNSESAWGFQAYNYKNVNYNEITPFVRKYFIPSDKIINIENNLLLKYNIDLNNCIAVYYRGSDKITETTLDSYDSYYDKLMQIISEYEPMNNKLQIIIQSDAGQFVDYMKNKLQNTNIICITENVISYTNNGIHNEQSNIENYNNMLYLLPTILIMSKCKYLICCSNNVSIVMMFYRYLYKNNIDNIFQNYEKTWL